MKRIRQRVNLSLDKDLLEFAKKWAYVTEKPLSRIIDDLFRRLKEDISCLSPEVWFEKEFVFSVKEFRKQQDEDYKAFEDFLNNQEEIEFCKNNPDSSRAKMRIKLLQEKEKRDEELKEEFQKQSEKHHEQGKEFIKRWYEVF